MERRFHVVFTGKLHGGFARDEAVEKMVLLFQLDRQKVAKLLSSGRPTIMKQGLSWEQAQRYQGHLEQIGLQMKIIEADMQNLQPSTTISAPLPPDPAKKNAPPQQPAPDIPIPVTQVAEAIAPPAPAEVKASAAVPDNHELSAGEEKRAYSGAPPFKVESSHGWLWIKEAFGMFFMQPLKWAGIMILLLVIFIPVVLIPYLGGLLSAVLSPIFHGGMMRGAQHQNEGGHVQIGHLFHGFAHNFGKLLLVGFFYFFGLLALAMVSDRCIGEIRSGISGTIPYTPEAIAAIIQNFPLYLVGLLGVAVLSIPLMMGFWFAPCLVTLDDRTPFASFRLSFRAVRINIVAFLIYGLVFLLLGMVFIFLYGVIAALFLFLLGSSHYFLSIFLPMLSMVLLGIPFAAIVPISIYTGYKDIFHGQAKVVDGLNP